MVQHPFQKIPYAPDRPETGYKKQSSDAYGKPSKEFPVTLGYPLPLFQEGLQSKKQEGDSFRVGGLLDYLLEIEKGKK